MLKTLIRARLLQKKWLEKLLAPLARSIGIRFKMFLILELTKLGQNLKLGPYSEHF